MSIRSADATIKGYFYQFNRTIEELLGLKNDGDSVVVEGIEDVDINSIDGTQAVQCKYYSSQSLTNSVVREPIILMLDHYRSPSAPAINGYTLYGYFKNEPEVSERSYTVDELKSILTYKREKDEKKYYEEHGITDEVLAAFLKKFILKTGKDFEEQRKDCITLLRRHYGCPEFTAENYYYNNAIRVIFDLSIQRNEPDRKITKKEFLKRIDCGKVLFYAWYKEYLSNKKYVESIRKGVKSVNLFSSGKEKLLFLGKGIDFSSRAMPLAGFVEELVNKYFQVGRTGYTAKPVTIVVDLDRTELLELKRSLIRKGLFFNDGHEEILFTCEGFCSDPVINRSQTGAGRITKASFVVRILSKETFDLHYAAFSKTFSVLAISEEDFDYPGLNFNQLVEVKYLTSLADIYAIL